MKGKLMVDKFKIQDKEEARVVFDVERMICQSHAYDIILFFFILLT
jgi:hypothetical protein